MTFGKWLREFRKQGRTVKYVTCDKCGGTQDTMVKKGDIYEHVRELDCMKYRWFLTQQKLVLPKKTILELAKPEGGLAHGIS